METINYKINKNNIKSLLNFEKIDKDINNKFSTNILPADNIAKYNSDLLSLLQNNSYLPIYKSLIKNKIYSNIIIPKVTMNVLKSTFNLEYLYSNSFNFNEAKDTKFIIIDKKSLDIIKNDYNLINFNTVIIYFGNLLPDDLGYLKEKGKLFFIKDKYPLCRSLFDIINECSNFNQLDNKVDSNKFKKINFVDTYQHFDSHSNTIKDEFTKYSIVQKLKNLNSNSFIELLEEITIHSKKRNLIQIMNSIISEKKYDLKPFFGTFYFLKKTNYKFDENIDVEFITEFIHAIDNSNEILYYNTIYNGKNKLLYFSIISIASCLQYIKKPLSKIDLNIKSYIEPEIASFIFQYLDTNVNSKEKNRICKISPILYHCLSIRDKTNPFDKVIELNSLIKNDGEEISCDIFFILLYNVYLKGIRDASYETKINLSIHIYKWLVNNDFYHVNSFEKALVLFFIESLPNSNIKYLIKQVMAKSKVDDNLVNYYYCLFKDYKTF